MKIQVDLRTAIALKGLLESKEVRELHEKLVKSCMETMNLDEKEAKQIIGQDWIQGCLRIAEEIAGKSGCAPGEKDGR